MSPDTGRPATLHEFRAGAGSPAALLDALDAAAVGLLEPMLGAVLLEGPGEGAGEDAGGHEDDAARASRDPGGAWRAGLAEALDRLAHAALALELIGLGHVATLLRAHLLEPCAPDAAEFEIAVAEAWISDAIAFCGGQLPAAEAAVLVERLRDWPALATRISPDLIEPIAARLRPDAERIAAATLAEMRARRGGDGPSVEAPPAPVSIGEDELAMLAEAAQTIPEIMETPAPYVVQTALSDFYVAYKLVVHVGADVPATRARVASDLHAAIQDAFNRHGVQIMSPHYEADPAAPKQVAETDWYAAPARGPG